MTENTENTEVLGMLDDEDDDESFRIFSTPKPGKLHKVYLGKVIKDSDAYNKLYELLETASGADEVHVYLNNYGGSIAGGMQLLGCLRSTAAKVKMIVAGPVYSMASLLAVCVEDVEIRDHTFLMFHDYSGGELGKGSEMFQSVSHYQKYFRNILKDVCGGFLTKQEIKDLCKGVDLYVAGPDAIKRLKKRSE